MTNASQLAVVACHFNPCHFQAPIDNWWRWWDQLPRDLTVISVELSFDGQFHTDSQIRLQGDLEKNCLWQKECLLNIGMRNLPPEVNRVAWIDADCLFHDPDWVAKTNAELDSFPLVQMFRAVNMLGAAGEVEQHAPSAMSMGGVQGPAQKGIWSKPGLAWAAHRDIIEGLGLYDRLATGAGDAALLWAARGEFNNHFFGQRLNQAIREDWLRWGARLHQRVRGRMGFVDMEVSHLYHGSRLNRQYGTREVALLTHGYDPERHVQYNADGVLEWTPASPPEMRDRLREYFQNRREDE